MTGSIHGLTALLGRAALMVGLLLVLAGFLGMHVMTASHSAHSSHAVSHGTVVHNADVPHDEASAPGPTAAGHPAAAYSAAEGPRNAAKPSLAPASCEGSCPGMQASGTACVPLAKAGSLTIAPPERSAAAEPALAARIHWAGNYSYAPASPTPCELSISRT